MVHCGWCANGVRELVDPAGRGIGYAEISVAVLRKTVRERSHLLFSGITGRFSVRGVHAFHFDPIVDHLVQDRERQGAMVYDFVMESSNVELRAQRRA